MGDSYMNSERFQHVVRPYSAEHVVKFQGTMPLNYTSSAQAAKLYRMMTYVEAVEKTLSGNALVRWKSECWNLSLTDLKALSKSLGAPEIHFDWEKARAVEGFYRFKGGTKCCAERAKAFAPFCDAVWMETGKPNV